VWGEGIVERLRGDFAFAVWDRARNLLFAARDPIGSRPLFFSEAADVVAIASSSGALADLHGGAALNVAALGTQVAGLAWALGADTAFDGVHPLPAGHTLTVDHGVVSVKCFWSPRRAPSDCPMDETEAAAELRRLICDAVMRRLGSGKATVWMSGGWDSTAVFAAGQHALPPADRSRLRPVSISYPPRDPGREDEYIEAVAAFWGADVHWLRSDGIPLLDGLEERATRSDEPPVHLYELWNTALAQGTRRAGARIALDGSGGDQLFQVSDVILADHLRGGRLMEFMRVARARRSRGWRYLARLGILPLVPREVMSVAEQLTGRTLPRHYMERTPTTWIRGDFFKRHDLRERDLAVLRHAERDTFAHTESTLYLTLPVWSWGASYMRGPLLRAGVEARSPLLDLSVVEFALARPVSERANARDTKTLLRRSMRGLLPNEVLAPRAYRTGLTTGFSRRRMKESYPALVARMFSRPLRLAELGIVDPAKLRAAAERGAAGNGDAFLMVNLFHTMKTEFWLRGLESRPGIRTGPAGTNRAPYAVPAA
jgi:asparagine synthase (glutamine-hydrolysing)